MISSNTLGQFTGTQSYTRWSPLFHRHVLTDGAKYIADEGSAYWLMDAIASYHSKCMRDPMLRDFQVWKLNVKDGKGKLTCWRDTGPGQKPVITQRFHTDFEMEEITLWLAPTSGPDGQLLYVIYLPSEH